MLRVTFAGSARGSGEVHLAFPSDCFPRATKDGLFTTLAAAGEHDRGRASTELVAGWKSLSRGWPEVRRLCQPAGFQAAPFVCPRAALADVVSWGQLPNPCRGTCVSRSLKGAAMRTWCRCGMWMLVGPRWIRFPSARGSRPRVAT